MKCLVLAELKMHLVVSSKILRKYEQVISNSLLATYPKHATQTNHLQQQALMLLDYKKKKNTIIIIEKLEKPIF